MELETNVTVSDILKRPLFQGAIVAGGNKGLSRRIRWVHIIETAKFGPLIHGEEMILTTGLAFKLDGQSMGTYVERLAEKNVSCLCIELGEHFEELPEEMVEAANRCELPLIVFPQTVRFVDITQDLHSLIINKHHKALKDLESISREFHRLTLTAQGVPQVLKLLHSRTAAQVIYYPVHGQPVCVPSAPQIEQKKLLLELTEHLQQIPDNNSYAAPLEWTLGDHRHVIVHPVGALGETWAYLAIILQQKPQEYDYLILDSASLSIAQDLLRTRYVQERKLYTENLWLDDLLHMRLNHEEQIKTFLGADYNKLNTAPYRVCLIELDHERPQETHHEDGGIDSSGIHLSMLLRALLEQHSYHPYFTWRKNGLAVIVFDFNTKNNSIEGLRHVFDSLKHSRIEGLAEELKMTIGIGGRRTGFKQAHLSYQEAIHAASLHNCFEKSALFFDELGVYQLLFNNDKNVLQTFVHHYLGPLIEHDETRGSALLHTLKVYLDCDGSKQIAAQKLYIVRQSLYYRLEKMAEMLGPNYMEPENRLALQLALRAYQMLNPDKMSGRF